MKGAFATQDLTRIEACRGKAGNDVPYDPCYLKMEYCHETERTECLRRKSP